MAILDALEEDNQQEAQADARCSTTGKTRPSTTVRHCPASMAGPLGGCPDDHRPVHIRHRHHGRWRERRQESLDAQATRHGENTHFAAFARRVISAHGRRVAQGDIEALPELVDLAASLNDAIYRAVIGLRDFGYSWTDVAARLGVSKQPAQQRWHLGTPPEPRTNSDGSAPESLFDDLETEAADDWA
jgi:hypothetical protein